VFFFLAKIEFINLSEAMEAMAGRSERDLNALPPKQDWWLAEKIFLICDKAVPNFKG
jgi:hypothetical protein